ncbi:MAG TPA: T9SS type A sorting domain-containing protein, partial [Candidatus Cloacimonadota bacterium]|nr:T9SS type A sorting domain-containing protein [Candidatus Cloacimonadota bacterium]
INNIRAVLNISNSNFSYNDLGIEISNTQYYCSNINNSTFSNNEYVGLRLYNAGINLVSSTITNNGTGINAYKSILMTNTTQGNPNNLISNNTHEEVLYCKASVLSLGYNRIVDNNYQTNTRDQYLIYNVDQTDDYFSIKNIFWGRDTNNQLIQPSTNRYAPQIFGDNDNIMPLYDYNLTINPPTNPEIRTLYENAIGLFNENENAQSQSMMYSIIEDYPDSDYAILATKSLLELYDLNEEEISELQYQYQNNQIFKVSPKLQKNAQNMKTEAFLMLSDYDSAIEDYLNLIAYPQTVTDSIFANIDIAYTLLLQEESGQKSPQSLSMQGLKPKNINEFYQTRNKYLSYLFNSNDEKDNETPSIPTSFLLSQNYPNPFNPETTISFDMPIEEHISLEIYNIKGQKVKTLVNEKLVPGRYILKWNGTDQYNKPVSSGIYFYKLKSASFTATKKMTLMK